MQIVLIVAIVIAVLGALAYANYRRFVPKPKSLGEKTYRVSTQVLTIPAGDHTLYAELLMPQGIAGKLPTVICSHGLGSCAENTRKMIGTTLAMSGYAVCCFEFYGGNLNSKSGGHMWDMSVFTEQDDLNAVMDYMKALDTTDPDKLILLGESQGGFVTAITAAQRPEEIRAVIEYYPAFCIPDDARARHGSVDKIPDRENFGGSLLGRVYSEKLMDYDIYQVIPAYTGPVLILHGDHDAAVNISYAGRAADAYEHAEFVCLPGEIHGFTGKGRKEAAKLSYQFLQRVAS